MWTWLEAESGLNTTASWLVLTFLLGLLVWRLLRARSAAGADLPPGPYCLPFLGYLPWIDSKAPYETFAKLSQRYGKIYSLKLGDMLAVFITDPELVRQAFSRDVFSGRAPLYLTHGIMKGHGENHSRHLDTSNDNNSISTYSGLICAEGEAWREHRKFVMNVMKQLGMAGRQGASLMESRVMDRVLEFVQVVYSPSSFFIIELVTIFVDFRKGLKESSPSSSDGVDLVPGLRHCIGNIINGVVFGRTYAADDPTWIWLQHLLDEGVKQVAVAGPINFLPVLRLPPTRQRISNFTYFNLVRWNFLGFCPDTGTLCHSSLTASRRLIATTKRSLTITSCPTIKVIHPSLPPRSFDMLTVARLSVICPSVQSIATWLRPTSSRWSVVGAKTKCRALLPSTNCTTCWPTCSAPARTRPWRPSNGSYCTRSSTQTFK